MFLSPSPPSFFGRQTVIHATLAFPVISVVPDHNNLEHKASILLIHPFGRIKVDIQNFKVPYMIVAISCSLPSKNNAFTPQKLKRDWIFIMRGSYSDTRSFLLIRGRPRYLTGRVPVGKPYAATAVVSLSFKSEVNISVLVRFILRPDHEAKS